MRRTKALTTPTPRLPPLLPLPLLLRFVCLPPPCPLLPPLLLSRLLSSLLHKCQTHRPPLLLFPLRIMRHSLLFITSERSHPHLLLLLLRSQQPPLRLLHLHLLLHPLLHLLLLP